MKLTNLIPIKAGKTLSRLCIIGALSLGSSFVFAQNQQVRLSGSNLTLKAAFKQIEQQTKLFVDYNTQDVNDSRVIKKVPAGNNVKNVLEQLLEGTNCSITFSNGHVIISRKAPVSSETKKVTGVVKDEKGEPIIGANVVEKGTTNGIITDIDGNFELNVVSSSVLQISYIGYVSQEILIGNKNKFHIKLVEDTQNLDEVVVVGYGTMRKKDMTGSVASADLGALKGSPNVNILQGLQGTLPGLNVGMVDEAGASPSITVRGRSTISGSQNPLIILDGIVYYGSLTSLNPNDIKSFDILKDASSKAIYGAQAANGVILITTKRGQSQDKPVITYNTSFSVGSPYNRLHSKNRDSYLQMIRDIFWQEAYTEESGYTKDNQIGRAHV